MEAKALRRSQLRSNLRSLLRCSLPGSGADNFFTLRRWAFAYLLADLEFKVNSLDFDLLVQPRTSAWKMRKLFIAAGSS
jgi:hypothetical protein